MDNSTISFLFFLSLVIAIGNELCALSSVIYHVRKFIIQKVLKEKTTFSIKYCALQSPNQLLFLFGNDLTFYATLALAMGRNNFLTTILSKYKFFIDSNFSNVIVHLIYCATLAKVGIYFMHIFRRQDTHVAADCELHTILTPIYFNFIVGKYFIMSCFMAIMQSGLIKSNRLSHACRITAKQQCNTSLSNFNSNIWMDIFFFVNVIFLIFPWILTVFKSFPSLAFDVSIMLINFTWSFTAVVYPTVINTELKSSMLKRFRKFFHRLYGIHSENENIHLNITPLSSI
ncbi:hypothetical protein T4B_6678 [Trichinella pseudospiralis]|uniref:G-protein coupled receptors family 1 profile domain-containing protein n=1 Tax=Trichinella pseudospiralis TaxID=6337 RepID=A0A0V1HYQ9_TRIPS|nr:hypothetical protein T4A_13038 [Trichinella pseudospiralis]KRZ15859.1 hypothetical protein T4B_6678 [Trichinella pseudospiralis]KRZ43233.1 hypothetical protein T4C_10256 [Trichinella pseudospiralis]